MRCGLVVLLLFITFSATVMAQFNADDEQQRTLFLETQQKVEQGDIESQFDLGLMYFYGRGVTQDYSKAIEWYSKAAGQGDADAQHNLSKMYSDAHGVAQDYRKAIEWYGKAAEQGYAYAQLNLGVMYLNGMGVVGDHQKGCPLIMMAVEQDVQDAVEIYNSNCAR